MNHAIRTAIVTALASLCLCASARAKVFTFGIPGAVFIQPAAINEKGQVTGFYRDASGINHGFLWQRQGGLTTFDCAGAVSTTAPVVISPAGAITGWCNGQQQELDTGFVRATDGSMTTFTVPHAAITIPQGANRKGWIVGCYFRNVRRRLDAFLRDPSGTTREFYVPGATGGAIASVVNNSQTVAGEAIIDGNSKQQGFVRTADGKSTIFGDPDTGYGIAGINDAGTIAGSAVHPLSKGFVRTADGTITIFVAPNDSRATASAGINNAGTVVGGFTDHGNVAHGFLRAADGTFTPFDVKGSIGTEIDAINDKGEIAGTYKNTDGVPFGFAGKP